MICLVAAWRVTGRLDPVGEISKPIPQPGRACPDINQAKLCAQRRAKPAKESIGKVCLFFTQMRQALMSEPNNTWRRCRRIATRVRYELSKLSPPELHELAQWLKRCAIRTVALESTGIYWIALYEVLEQQGFEVRVVNARH